MTFEIATVVVVGIIFTIFGIFAHKAERVVAAKAQQEKMVRSNVETKKAGKNK